MPEALAISVMLVAENPACANARVAPARIA